MAENIKSQTSLTSPQSVTSRTSLDEFEKEHLEVEKDADSFVIYNEDDLSPRGELFKTKIIRMFHLLDFVGDEGQMSTNTEGPELQIADITNDSASAQTLKNNPNSLVQFRIYTTKEKVQVPASQRIRNKIENKHRRWPPLKEFAKWLVAHQFMRRVIFALLIIDLIALGVLTQMNENSRAYNDWHTPASAWITAFEIIDDTCLLIFTLEVLLKLYADFCGFWLISWNVFDFIITFLSLGSELANYQYTREDYDSDIMSNSLQQFRTFRVLLSLKILVQFENTRIIMRSIGRAFKELTFTSALLLILGYFYAMLAIKFFSYSNPNDKIRQFPMAYYEFTNACMTLFQILTNDHWVMLLQEQGTPGTGYFWYSVFFTFSWLLMASYILKNLLIGVLVDSLVWVRSEQELLELEEQKRLQKASFSEDEKISGEALIQDDDSSDATGSVDYNSTIHSVDQSIDPGTVRIASYSTLNESSVSTLHAYSSYAHTFSPTMDSGGIEDRLTFGGIEDMLEKTERNLQHLVKLDEQVMWPRDTLLSYFMMMEQYQENLLERQRLILLAKNALLVLTDT